MISSYFIIEYSTEKCRQEDDRILKLIPCKVEDWFHNPSNW